MLPTFIIAGAARSGTTSIYRYCSEHPDIFVSAVKETNYFSSNPFGFTRRSYERLFERCGDVAAVGEASPSYLYDESAPSLIRDMIPDCRTVVILRNPVERFISDFFYSRSWGANHNVDFSSFVNVGVSGNGAAHTAFAPGLTAEKGRYAEQVRRYLDVFTCERVFIRLHEDLQSDPVRFMADLYAFLDVDPSFTPRFRTIHNGHSEPVFPTLSQFFRRARRIETRILSPLLPSHMYGCITKPLLAVNRRRRMDGNIYDLVLPSDRDRLSTFYRRDIEKLQQLLGRDLAVWLE